MRKFSVDITRNFYNSYHPQKSFFVEKYFESWDPKIHGPHNYLQSFLWPLSLKNRVSRSIIRLQCFEMLSLKIRDRLIKARWMMELLCRLLILKWYQRKREIIVPHLKKIRMRCYSIKHQDDALFKNR